jgi:hypothetical protein
MEWVEYDTGTALLPHEAIEGAYHALLDHGHEVDAGHWQGYATLGRPDLMTKELLNLTFTVQIPDSVDDLVEEVRPNMPWAEEEFLERVGCEPHNPHDSLEKWPWWNNQIEVPFTPFTHTYSERFWPKYAGMGLPPDYPENRQFPDAPIACNKGIRYEYGDLSDVVKLLIEHPHTRQATFPIFFPEDTGAVHGGRIPCTLHYHFLLRDNRLHMWYPIRSCDAHRHFRDDLYMAMRLNQWVLAALIEHELRSDRRQVWVDVDPGILSFTAYSFHVHMGDLQDMLGHLT